MFSSSSCVMLCILLVLPHLASVCEAGSAPPPPPQPAISLRPLWASLGGVLSVDYSPDASTLLTTNDNGLVQTWNASTLAPLLVLPDRSLVACARYSKDGRRIVSGSTAIKVWDAQTGALLVSVENAHESETVSSVTFSPDGTTILSGGEDDTVRMWDARTLKPIVALSGHKDAVMSVGFSPDGKKIVSGSMDNTARIWDISSGLTIATLHTTFNVHSATFSPDGARILIGSVQDEVGISDTIVSVWDAATGQQLFEVSGTGYVADYSPDGSQIVSGNSASLFVMDANSGDILHSFSGAPSTIFSVRFSPNGKLIAAAGGGDGLNASNYLDSLQVWNVQTGSQAIELVDSPFDVQGLDFSADGRALGVAYGGEQTDDVMLPFRILNAANGTQSTLFSDMPHNPASSIAFARNSSQVVVGMTGTDSNLGVWDASSGRLLLMQNLSDSVGSVSFSPDGSLIAASCVKDDCIFILNARTGKPVTTIPGDGASARMIAFSADGKRIASTTTGSAVSIWNVGNGKKNMTLQLPEGNAVFSVAFSRDGQKIAGCGSYIWIWDASSGRLLKSISAPGLGFVYSLSFSPDSSLLATGSDDNGVRIWSVASGQQVLLQNNISFIPSALSFSPDGKYLATALGTEVRVWSVVRS